MFKTSKILPFLLLILSLLLSKEFFAQQTNPCLTQNAIRVVVLGSSTAAGSGPSSSDSAWVNRYKDYLLSIHPDNEVINLAQGGYTTYRIMRTGYTPPSGRPAPDVNKNITAALALNPDAIIVNMPSNDVSNGYSYQEQMDNLDSIVALASSVSVPIWICTTQPKNYNNASTRQLQFDIKDSIVQFYAPNTIDFWSTIALPDHSIDPQYDSGDGTHLNDAAHAILNNRVIQVDIPSAVYSPNTNTPDYAIIEASPAGFLGCGDSITTISVVVANLGIAHPNDVSFVLHGLNTLNGQSFYDSIAILGGLSACSVDTINFTLNLFEKGNYNLVLDSTHPSDTLTSNDSLFLNFETSGHPEIIAIHDTLCKPGIGFLSVSSNLQDTVFWYSTATDTFAIGNGPTFSSGPLSTTTTYYAESIRGDLFYRNQLETSLNSNVNWNGAMFDIVANENLILDSFYVKINTLGTQLVNVYTKTGSHLGFETNASAWTLLGTATVNVTSVSDFTILPIGNINLSLADTLGVYIQMNDANAKISYQSVSTPISRSTQEVEIITGSGIGYNFANSYYPRDLNCGVFYHFGYRPEGDCSTGKIPVTVYISNTTFSLGNDTIIDLSNTVSLSCPAGYSDYLWSDGSTSSTNQIVANDLGQGIHIVSVSFIDTFGCLRSDSIIIGIANLLGINELENDFFIYPNPAKDRIHFSSDLSSLIITNALGKEVLRKNGQSKTISIVDLSDGVYFLEYSIGAKHGFAKIIKSSH